MSVRKYKLCVLGNQGVGKSCLLDRLLRDTFTYSSGNTIGVSYFFKKMELDGINIEYTIIDTSGEERYRAIPPIYYRNADTVLIVYDITSQESIPGLLYWMKELEDHAPVNVVIAIAGNKVDMEGHRVVPAEAGKEYADQHGAIFAETSALTAVNVNDLFKMISRRLIERDRTTNYYSDVVRTDAFQLHQPPAASTSGERTSSQPKQPPKSRKTTNQKQPAKKPSKQPPQKKSSWCCNIL